MPIERRFANIGVIFHMVAYTLLWNEQTWEKRKLDIKFGLNSKIDYIAVKAGKPQSQFESGDEIFIVNVKGGQIRLGGRMVVLRSPVSEADARARLGEVLPGKDLYVLADPRFMDAFRPSHYLPQAEAFGLELLNTKGEMKNPAREPDDSKLINRQEFRQSMRISDQSASVLRRSLGLNLPVLPSKSFDFAASTEAQTDSFGQLLDATRRRIVEMWAVQKAVAHYRDQGYEVQERGKPYDLLCTRGDEVRHIEVKGTTTKGAVVRLTRNEVADARDQRWKSDLFVVSEILLAPDAGQTSWAASGGVVQLRENWVPRDEDLTPTEFEYRL